MIEISQKHKVNTIRALFHIVKQLGINKSCYFKFDIDHDDQTNEILYNAKYFIKDCKIASKVALKKKQTKILCAKATVDTLFTLSTLHISLDKVMPQRNAISVFNQTSSLDTFNSSISHPSMETCVEKPCLILNKAMYDLCIRNNFVIVKEDDSKVTSNCIEELYFLRVRLLIINNLNTNWKIYLVQCLHLQSKICLSSFLLCCVQKIWYFSVNWVPVLFIHVYICLYTYV